MNTDIVFVALARNCAPYASKFFWFVDALSSLSGLRSRAIVGENGSTDGTRLAFQRSDVMLVDTSIMSSIPERLKRMAVGRQLVRDFAVTLEPRAFCVIDLDNTMSTPPSPAGLAAALQVLESGGHFAVASQSSPFYYDLLAYEDDVTSFAGLDRKIISVRNSNNPFLYYALFKDEIYPAQRRLTSNRSIECISAFNGLCIYDQNAYRLGSYIENADFTLCEHVNFNRLVHRQTGKKILISPDLQISMPREHGPCGPFAFAARRAAKMGSHIASKLRAPQP